jgi:S-methylmethionine-dependent homocysteine/selenocysteine methylase
MAQKDWVYPLVLTSVDTAGIAVDTWTAFSASGIEEDVSMIRLTNDSDTDVYISFNGADDHEYIPAGETIEVNFQANSSPPNYRSMLKKGTVLSVQGVAGTGLVYLSGYYNAK